MPELVPFSQLANVNPPLSIPLPGPEAMVSFIPMADVSDAGEWVTRQSRRLLEIGPGYTPFQDGDVLFAKITPCMENGKGCQARGLVNRVGFGSTEFHVLRSRGDTSSRFIYHWSRFESLRRKAETAMTGSAGQQRVEAAFFDRFRVPELPPREQMRIAEFLDIVDEAVQETEAVVAKLRHLKAGLLHDLLTRGLDADGQFRDPIRHPEHFQDTPLGRIPKDWEIRKCIDLFTLRSGITPSRAEFGRYYEAGTVPWVKTLDLNEGWIQNTDENLTTLALRVCGIEVQKPRTILVAMYGGWEQIGRTAILGITAATNQAVCALSPKTNDIEPEFALRVLQHRRNAWKRVAASSRKDPNITKSDVASFFLPVPKSNLEQQRIAAHISAADERITIEEAKLAKLHSLKRGLANDLLTGQVRVKV